jgi:hypothetical protein
MPSSRKFTTSSTGESKEKPVAVLARQRLDAVVGSVIRLDGRESYDPENLPLTWKWSFRQVPIGSALTDTSFRSIRPKSRAVSFTPDKIGIYVVELVVNNGDLDSDPTTAVVGLQISRVPCGENLVPDAHFLWDYISDFWRLVDDRDIIEAIWSAHIQMIGSELITLWDTDNNKSLSTIQSRLQRRWQAFHPVTELIDEVQHRIIVGKTNSGDNASTGSIDQAPGVGNTSIISVDLVDADFTDLRGNYGVKGRVIVVNDEAYTLSRVENNDTAAKSLAFVDEEAVPDGLAGVSWRIPHLLHMPDVDLEEVGARAGDVLVFDVTRGDIGLSAELRTQVVGVDRNRMGFEFTLSDLAGGSGDIDVELFEQLALDLRILPPDSLDAEVEAVARALIQFIPVGINLNTRPFTKFQLTFKAKKIIHNTVAAVDEKLASVPALQEKIKDAPVILRENLDYIVEDGKIQFVSGLFTPGEPAPEKLWAECVWLDNADTIENNFGRMAGLTQDALTASQTRTPYLSAVKGLFYALVNSPSVANLRLALQILLGLPFTEERGIILEIDDSFSVDSNGNTLGRILMEDLDDFDGRTAIRRFHFYSPIVGLEDNPATGEVIKVGDILERFTPLSKGVLVEDYIKNPTWWEDTLNGLEVLKFFTFHVVINSKIFDSNDVNFGIDFIQKIKPAYTNILTAALAELVDDIDLADDLAINIVARFYDNTWGLEATNRVDDYNQQGAVLFNGSSHPFSTRTVKMLRDVWTRKVGSVIEVYSETGWDTAVIRARDDSAIPFIEGDIVYIHEGQLGAGIHAPGLWEIDRVQDDGNTLDLLARAPGTDPTTFVTTPLDADIFELANNLTACILRRETNPVLRGSDLVTSVSNNEVTSAGAGFLLNGVGVGDHLIIESGANAGEYYITELLTPPSTYISATQVALLDLDGSVATFSTATGQSFRVIRPIMSDKRITGARSIYNSGGGTMELEVPDPDLLTSFPFDVFTPSMVGMFVEVSSSDQSINDGRFQITSYINSGRVAINSPSTTSDTAPQAVINM